MTINVVSSIPAEADCVVYPLINNELLSNHLAQITQLLDLEAPFLAQDFQADAKQTQLLYANGKRIFLVGLGKEPKANDCLKAFRSFVFKQKKNLPNHVAIDLSTQTLDVALVEALVNGIVLANNDLGIYKSEPAPKAALFGEPGQILLVTTSGNAGEVAAAAAIGAATAETQSRIMDLVNAPANHKFPQKLADWAVASGQKYGFEVQVFDEKACAEIGLKALLAVSKGSENPPRFLVLEYKHPQATRRVGLVGKGVTFDTGGVSIKPSANMNYMKSDMGGAGAVLGTIELAAKLQLPVHLIGVIPATENSVDGAAIKPGDVIGSYAGKTIEVIDTDAEGRLILADGLAYLNRNYAPDVLIDLATLTGSCVATLGYAAAGLFSNNLALSAKLQEMGQQTGEKLWPLPLWDDYQDEIKSDVADLKNYHGKPIAGAIVAAKFLEVFAEKHPAWAHLDIAGTAFADSEFGSMKSATAYGVRLLTHWLRK